MKLMKTIWHKEKFVLLRCATFSNNVRYQMFCANNSCINQLPPCRDSLRFHIAISVVQITKRQSESLVLKF